MTSTAANRREVVVNGRRVRVIDVHAHCVIPEAMTLLGQDVGFAPLLKENAGERLQAMDEQGIDIEALSINPFWYGAERDLAAGVIRVQNEKLVEFCAVAPERFVARASVALRHPEPAASQLADGV